MLPTQHLSIIHDLLKSFLRVFRGHQVPLGITPSVHLLFQFYKLMRQLLSMPCFSLKILANYGSQMLTTIVEIGLSLRAFSNTM